MLPACEIAYHFLRERGREQDAARYRERAERQVEVLDAAEDERSGVSVDDELEPPDLPEEELERIRRKVAWHEDVVQAYLVRKRAAHLDDTHPFYVLALVPKGGFRAALRDTDGYEPLEQRVARDLRSMDEELMIARVDWKSPIARASFSGDIPSLALMLWRPARLYSRPAGICPGRIFRKISP